MNKILLRKLLLLLALLILFNFFVLALRLDYIHIDALRAGTAQAVCSVQKLFGVNCAVSDFTVRYEQTHILITALCVGIDQALFVALILFVFLGFKDRRRTGEILLVLLFVLLLNFFRLLAFYPLSLWLGFGKAAMLYEVSYDYLQTLVLLAIAMIYLWFRDTTFSKRTRRKEAAQR